MTKQPAPEAEAEVVQTFSFTFFCPYNTRTFSRMLKRFAAMNHFATTKLVKLKTHKHHEEKYLFGIALRQTSSLKSGTESSNLRLVSVYLFATCQKVIRNILELSQKNLR